MNQETLESRATSSGVEHHYWSMVLPVVTGDLDKVIILHQRGTLGDGVEGCLLAAANGQLSILQYLHQFGCDLVRISHRILPLAAANGRLDVLKYLHTQGCDIHIGDDAAIKAAAAKNQLSVLKYLHEQGADPSTCHDIAKLLLLAPKNKPTTDYLASNGINPSGPQTLLLLQAIKTRKLALIQKNFTDIDVNLVGGLLVGAAAAHGDRKIMTFLRQNGCNIHADGELAIRTAAENGHVDLLEYLHNIGVDLHANHDHALKLAAENGHLRAVVFLSERGADVAKIKEDTLALIELNGHTRVFNYLTDSGLDAIKRHRPTIVAMREELYAAKPVYRPSKLWEFFNDINMEQLRLGGMNGFKRSVNQNYFNFIPYSLLDPQLLRLTSWWVTHPTLTPFKVKVVDPDIVPGENLLLPLDRRVFRLAHRYPTVSYVTRKIQIDLGRTVQLVLYRWLLAMLWDFVQAHDKLGLASRLTESRLGSPVEAYHEDRLISQDLAHSILECNSIFGEIDTNTDDRPLRIAEIGAGYGRLGCVILHAVRCRYVVIDIPPSLYISQWYLSKLFHGKQVFRFRHFERFEDIAEELAQADIAFFSANQIDRFPQDYFDLTISISSLHELRLDQIDNMLDQIYRTTRSFVYLKQYKEYFNPYDGLRILEDSYKLPRGWNYRYYRNDPVDPRFFETLIERQSPPALADSPASLHSRPDAGASAKAGEIEPTVSILLASYNHAEYLPTSLAGICGQTHPATEIIIVDDGSTDDSVALIEEFAARFSNIKLLKNGRNRGQYYSIQRALQAAQGDYIVWAASDDLLLPHFLERSLGMLRKYPEAGLCFSRLSVFVDGTTEVRHYTEQTQGVAFNYGRSPHYLSSQQLAAVLRKHYVWMSGNTVVARRSALLEMGGFERSLRWHADWFAYYVVALRYGACVIPETLALMRERRGTYSSGGIADPVQQSRVLKAIFDTIKSPKYRDVRSVFQSCPSLLSLFGKRALFVAVQNSPHWGLGWSLARWHGPRFLRQKLGRLYGWLAALRGRYS